MTSMKYLIRYNFHYVESDNLIVMCMTDQAFARGSAFVYLDEIRTTFLKEFSVDQVKNASAHALKSFNKTLKDKMNYYNNNKEEVDKIVQLEKGIRMYSDDVIQANRCFYFNYRDH